MALQQIKPTLVIVLESGLASLEHHLGLSRGLVPPSRIRWSDRDHRGRHQDSQSKESRGDAHLSGIGINPFWSHLSIRMEIVSHQENQRLLLTIGQQVKEGFIAAN